MSCHDDNDGGGGGGGGGGDDDDDDGHIYASIAHVYIRISPYYHYHQ